MTKEQFVSYLKAYRHRIPKQTLKTLRGQSLAGDVDGAIRGLAHILKKNRKLLRHPLDFHEVKSVNVVTPKGE